MKLCCAVGCHNKQELCPGLAYYRIPADKTRRDRWIAAIRRENWTPSHSARICGEHFISGKKSNDPLSPDYVPSVFKHTPSPSNEVILASRERRASTRKKRAATCTCKKFDVVPVYLRLADDEEQLLPPKVAAVINPLQGEKTNQLSPDYVPSVFTASPLRSAGITLASCEQGASSRKRRKAACPKKIDAVSESLQLTGNDDQLLLQSSAAAVINPVQGDTSKDPLSPVHNPSPLRAADVPLASCDEERESSRKRRKATCPKKIDAVSERLQLARDKDRSLPPTSSAVISPVQAVTGEPKLLHNETSAFTNTHTSPTSQYHSQEFEELQTLRIENSNLRAQLNKSSFTVAGFEGNDAKVCNMTGLSTFAVLMAVFNLVKDHIPVRSVDPFTQFVMVLLRLRHALSYHYLAYTFDVSVSNVSQIFDDVIDSMFCRLVPVLVFWPEREQIRLTLPMPFRGLYKKCISIIDCFEVLCEQPSDPKARAQAYSHHKSHSTVKYLLSVTPNGFIMFNSKGWGGRTSDQHLVDHSGYLDHLLPGDLVLADRDFDIAESVELKCAFIEIPTIPIGKKQLCAKDRQMAAVRIQMEKVVSKLRMKYSILKDIIPVSLLHSGSGGYTTLDKMVLVSCALCNASEGILSVV